ncbi:MAG: AAA family ATPase [Verrucomicrobiales bacterium]
MNTLREALDESPENLPLRLVYARRCEEAFAFNDAWIIYAGILEKHPGNPSAHLGMARTLFFQGKISEAEVRAQGLIEEHPKFAEGHLFLARVLSGEGENQGDLALAAHHYRIALSIDPNLAEPALDRDLGPIIRTVESVESQVGESDPTIDHGSADPFADDWFYPTDEDEFESPFEIYEAGDDEAGSPSDYDDGGFIDALKQGMDSNGMRVSDLDAPTIDFNDVGGMCRLKEDIRMKIVHPIKNPQLFKAYGIQAGGSMLLYGPPGCGKSLLGEALDGEVNASFYTLGLHQLLDAGIGRAEKQLHEIFHIAKMNAPSVLFLDEVDAIAGFRNGAGDSNRSPLLNQLLHELDEVSKCADGVLVIAATSAPWLLDPALHRAGRFDRRICVGPPCESDRVDIIRVLRNRIPVTDLDAEAIAAATPGFSGAELSAVFENAAERAIAASIKVGCFQPLTTGLILSEVARMRPSGEQWMELARNEVEKARVSESFRPLFDRQDES